MRQNTPAPGAPELAARVGELLAGYPLHADPDRGLDHGAWAVLRHFYPEADVPVVQLGLNVLQPAAWHWALAEKLRPLRDEGVLIMGSGNIVHNLRELDFARVDEPFAYDWAEAFCNRINRAMLEDDRDTLINYLALDDARRAVPAPFEHYLPLLLRPRPTRVPASRCAFFNDEIIGGSLSMTAVQVGV